MRIASPVLRTFSIATALVAATAIVSAVRVEIDDSVPTANPRVGSPDNQIIEPYRLARIAQGSDPLENPSGVITRFGLLFDNTRTEPDENTYVEFEQGLPGPTPGYPYGRRFLFQGHENGNGLAYVTRINLDVTDPAHRITLLTPPDGSGKTGFGSIDGSTWNPYTRTLLFTQESSSTKGVIEITPSWPPVVRTLEGVIGQGGFEGIHPDDQGDLLIVEDAGGTTVNVIQGNAGSPKTARQPNSFVFKFHPYDKTNLAAGGTLYSLQVWINGAPLTFHSADPVGDTFSSAQLALHTPSTTYGVVWVPVHDTLTDGSAAFNANTRAKSAGATPFKRPENAQFQPQSKFETFYFDVTGDTDADAGNQPALAARGSWGGIFRVHFDRGSAIGTIGIEALGDAAHASFDNMAFADRCTLLLAEDRGDTLHAQLNAMDSVWAYRVCDRGEGNDRWSAPRRLIAVGRDPLATAEDNEPTGLHVSNGDTSIGGILGRVVTEQTTRWFVTQQHGMNQVFEISKRRP